MRNSRRLRSELAAVAALTMKCNDNVMEGDHHWNYQQQALASILFDKNIDPIVRRLIILDDLRRQTPSNEMTTMSPLHPELVAAVNLDWNWNVAIR